MLKCSVCFFSGEQASWRLGLSLEGRFGGLHEERYFPLRKIRELFGSFAYVNLNKKHP